MNNWELLAGVVFVAVVVDFAAWYAWRVHKPGIEAGLLRVPVVG